MNGECVALGSERDSRKSTEVDSDQYAKAKELFFELVHKSQREQSEVLDAVATQDPEFAAEVRSLLSAHSSRTIIGPTVQSESSRPKSSSRSTLGLMKWKQRLVGGILPFAIALFATLLISFVGWYLHQEMTRRDREEYRAVLSTLASQKVKRIIHWAESYQSRIQDWGQKKELQQWVHQLDDISSRTSDEPLRRQHLREAEPQRLIRAVFDEIGARSLQISAATPMASNSDKDQPRLKYAIWNAKFQLLTDWQFDTESVQLGSTATATGKWTLSRVFETRSTLVVLPQPNAETVSRDYPLEREGQYVMFFVPVFSPFDSSEVIGALMVRCDLFLEELKEILLDRVFEESNCYLLNEDMSIASEAHDIDRLLRIPNWRNVRMVRGNPVVLCLDPGEPVLARGKISSDVTTWTRTLAARGIAMKEDGQNVDGYNDYRGIQVVGAWKWIPGVEAGLVLEVPMSIAYRNISFVSRAFQFMLAIPILCALGLLAMSILRVFRNSHLTNRTVGPYRLQDKIGEGGLGVVYRGEHQMLGRSSAVKLIKPGNINSGAVRRFEREVRLAAGLNHTNAVSIYDFGMSQDGLLYCAMELVDGVTLGQLVSCFPEQPLNRCLAILHQVSLVLAEAHGLGLIHRDIKPQNVMICRRSPSTDHVKVVDFGLAKQIGDTLSREQTATRVVMGTPGFIAPERLESPWIADPKVDIFSFGVLGMYLFSAKVPPIGLSLQECIQSIQNPSTQRSLTDPKVHSWMERMVKCASPSPSHRPDSMEEICMLLERLTEAYPWTKTDAEDWWAAHEGSLAQWLLPIQNKSSA